MLYPKIERKSLALVLIFLVLTLATVGIMFVMYFFYTDDNSLFAKSPRNNVYSSSNLKINKNSDETYHHRHQSDRQQLLLPESDSEKSNPIGSKNNRSRLIRPVKASKTVVNGRRNQSQPRDRYEIEASDETYSNSNFYASSDTIYIDDYDRPIDVNVKSAAPAAPAAPADINKIDYFETIIMDHRSGQQKLSLNRKRGPAGNRAAHTKPLQPANKSDESTSSDEFSDNDTIGSGSGDFIDEEENDNTAPRRHLNSSSANFHSELVHPSTSRPLNNNNNKKWIPPSIVSSREQLLITTTSVTGLNSQHVGPVIASIAGLKEPLANHKRQNSGAWLETRARRIMGNVKKSEERSRQLLLCAEASGGELCRMLFKGHLNE